MTPGTPLAAMGPIPCTGTPAPTRVAAYSALEFSCCRMYVWWLSYVRAVVSIQVVEVVGMAGARAAKVTDAEEPKSAEQVFAAARSRQPAGPQVYVVQVRGHELPDHETFVPNAEGHLWHDVATVEVPPRSKRRTIIERALNAAETPIELPVTLRILDADAAREFPVGLKPRDPELVIG